MTNERDHRADGVGAPWCEACESAGWAYKHYEYACPAYARYHAAMRRRDEPLLSFTRWAELIEASAGRNV